MLLISLCSASPLASSGYRKPVHMDDGSFDIERPYYFWKRSAVAVPVPMEKVVQRSTYKRSAEHNAVPVFRRY